MRPQTFFGPSEGTKYYYPEELFFLWSGRKKGSLPSSLIDASKHGLRRSNECFFQVCIPNKLWQNFLFGIEIWIWAVDSLGSSHQASVVRASKEIIIYSFVTHNWKNQYLCWTFILEVSSSDCKAWNMCKIFSLVPSEKPVNQKKNQVTTLKKILVDATLEKSQVASYKNHFTGCRLKTASINPWLLVIRDLSRDDCIEEFIKRIWSSGLVWAVGLQLGLQWLKNSQMH